MTDWVVWLLLAGGLLVAELFTLTFVLGLFGVAAAIAGLAGVLGVPLAPQFMAFAGASGLLWVLVRPLERMHRNQPALATGTRALTGRHAVVVEAVTQHSGRVTLGGESWAARTLTPGPALEPGSNVAVAQVDGATLVVFPEEI